MDSPSLARGMSRSGKTTMSTHANLPRDVREVSLSIDPENSAALLSRLRSNILKLLRAVQRNPDAQKL